MIVMDESFNSLMMVVLRNTGARGSYLYCSCCVVGASDLLGLLLRFWRCPRVERITGSRLRRVSTHVSSIGDILVTCQHRKASGFIRTSITISVNHDNQDYGGFLEVFEGARSVEATSNLEADN